MDKVKIEERFWKALKADRTVSIGTKQVPPRPMTALLAEGALRGPLWIFTSKDSELVQAQDTATDAVATFASKGHDTFATMTGILTIDPDPSMIDALWNPFVAAWFPEGKSDPKLALLRYTLDSAEIWTDASSLVAGAKILLGIDPKADYRQKVASVEF